MKLSMLGPRGKLLVSAALLIVTGAFFYSQLRSPARLKRSVNFVCALTGKCFWLDRDAVITVPARNPETGEMTLLPCRVDNGALHVVRHYAAALRELGDRNRCIDPQTLEVRSPS